jgi:hypothetical protein
MGSVAASKRGSAHSVVRSGSAAASAHHGSSTPWSSTHACAKHLALLGLHHAGAEHLDVPGSVQSKDIKSGKLRWQKVDKELIGSIKKFQMKNAKKHFVSILNKANPAATSTSNEK